MDKKQVIVVQLTHRRNYDIAEHLSRENSLHCLCTDFYRKGWMPKNFRRLDKKYNNLIAEENVRSSQITGICFFLLIKALPRLSFIAYYIGGFLLFLHSACYLIKTRKSYTTIYGFDTNSFWFFVLGNMLGKELILEQCVASRMQQASMYSKLSTVTGKKYFFEKLNVYFLRLVEKGEHRLADIIVVPSEFVKRSLSGFADKAKLVRYKTKLRVDKEIIDSAISRRVQSWASEDIRVLFVGNGNERKGYLDILTIAHSFPSVTFVLVGDLIMLPKSIPENVKVKGKLYGEELSNEFLTSHLFMLPSYLEGSALVGIEACVFGLPAITTFESGSYIRNNIHGKLFSAGNIPQLMEQLRELISLNTDDYKNMSKACLKHASLLYGDSSLLNLFDENL